MKLAIASGIIAIALPISSKGDDHVSLTKPRNGTLMSKPKSLLVQRKFGDVFRHRQGTRRARILSNTAHEEATKVCDPLSLDADIGILSCGPYHYCMESKDSDLGGVCTMRHDVPMMSERNMLADGYYHSMTAYYCTTSGDWTKYLTCDCSLFDTTNLTGSVKCSLAETYCFQDTSCETCVDLTVAFDVASIDSYSVDWCYKFLLPYEQNVCIEYSHDPVTAAACSIEFNDKKCRSCDMFYYDYTDPVTTETFQGTCADFDCTNTDGKHSADLCEASVNIPTILDQTCSHLSPFNERESPGLNDEATTPNSNSSMALNTGSDASSLFSFAPGIAFAGLVMATSLN
jgi:hypothetical protein